MNLYRWQRECLTAWKSAGERGIVRAVTGTGKTVLALEAIDHARKKYRNLVVKIVVPSVSLAHQWQRALLHHMKDEQWRPGFYGGGKRDDPDRKILIYIINSARDSLARHARTDLALGRHILLICDECHHYQSRMNRKIFDFLTKDILEGTYYHCLGLSATPFGTENDELLIHFLGNEIYRYSYDDALLEGTISPFTVCEVSASFFAGELARYADLSDQIRVAMMRLFSQYPGLKELPESSFLRAVSKLAHEADMDPSDPAAAFLLLSYQRKEISNLAFARIACAQELLLQLDDRQKILVFCERISQAQEMAASIRRRQGNICGIYHSQMTREARFRVMDDFRHGRIRILVSCRCLDEGIDVPDADTGIVISSSAVERQRIQRLGRIIRKASGKTAACLYYIYIRESSDDAAYLKGLETCESFSLRYYTSENTFSNELYEYVSRQLIRNAKEKRLADQYVKELRSCLMEGLTRADYLLPGKIQKSNMERAENRHSENYWRVMYRVGQAFRQL